MINEKVETTVEGFRKLSHDVIFIAGSQDIKSLRSDVEWAIKNTLHQLTPGSEIRPYSWDIETSDTGFDQTKSMQKALPRPSDEKCLGVICLMAERIGHPLEDDFDLQLVHGVKAWTEPGHNYKLVHPWPNDLEEQKSLIEEGCYPLTGTVFEFIDGYSTKADNKTPVRFCVIADKSIEPNNHQSVRLGNFRLPIEKMKDRSISSAEFDLWKQNDYNLQTAAVKNFVCALSKKGIDQNALQDREKVIEDVKRFVAREIIKNSFQYANPYKFLDYFDVFDTDNFYGREQQIKRAARDLWDRFDSPRDDNIVRIAGPSGAGKSSFLRAGLIARFQQPEYRGDVRTVVFRPTDFQKADETALEIIRSIFDFVEQQTDLVIPPKQRIDICKQGLRAGQLAVELLHSLLPKATNGKTSKLVFGVDQFEEIVDYLSDKKHGNQWYPLLQFIEAAAQSESIGVAYTLESSRKDSLAELDLPVIFTKPDEILIDGFYSEFIRIIIEEPFKKAGYPLSREVVRKIEENAKSLIDGPQTENSILPLVALKLSQLFEHIQNEREPITNTDLIETSSVAFDENASQNPSFIQLDEVHDQLNFNSLIEAEAKKAWREGSGVSYVDPTAIDFFLQPLVGIGGPKLDHLQLHIMHWPPYSAEQKLAECFKRHRLLIPTAGGLRLVHEAVIRHWPDALKWFENKQDFLKMEVLFRSKAIEWSNNGRLVKANAVTEDNINNAACILSAYLRAWSIIQKESDFISEDDKLLRDYCLFVFRHSRTPDKLIQYMGTAGNHVFRAAQYGMIDLLEDFRQIDPNCLELTTESGSTPLHGAAWASVDTVDYLLQKGVNPAPKNVAGWPPIAAPIQRGRMDIFTLLLKASDGDGLDGPDGITMLHSCASYGQVRMASILVDFYRLDPNHRDKNQWMPLHRAAHAGQLDAFIYFANLSDITAVTDQGHTALHLAASNGCAAIVDYLLQERRFRRHLNGKTNAGENALHLACRNRYAEIVRKLLQACDPNEPIADKDNSYAKHLRPLHLALPQGFFDISYNEDDVFATVYALLGHPRTDPNAVDWKGDTPLALASKLRKVQKTLLRHPRLNPNKPVSKEGEIPLIISAKLGDWEAYRALEERSVNISHGLVDKAKNTRLHLLIAKHAPEDLIDNILSIATSADLNALNDERLTPLMIAIQEKNWMLVRQLLTLNGIEPTRHGDKKQSALLLALEMGADKDTLSKLIEVSPSLLTEPDYFGWTPLHRAIASQQLDWIEWLTVEPSHSAILWEHVDRLGRQPVDLASPLLRESLSLGEGTIAWPRPKSWDSDLKWKLVDAAKRVNWVGLIASVDESYAINDDTEIYTAALSFYNPKTVRIVRIKSPAWNYIVYYLKHNKNLYRLNGTSPPIYEINSKGKIALNADNVLEYLRFYCFFVRGEEGPFLIAESPDQAEIPSTLNEAERGDLLKILRPASFNGYDEKNSEFLIMAPVYYSNAIFIADFAVQKTGMIEMINDHPVLSNLSTKVSIPLVG